jgi:hypothetical protein
MTVGNYVCLLNPHGSVLAYDILSSFKLRNIKWYVVAEKNYNQSEPFFINEDVLGMIRASCETAINLQ